MLTDRPLACFARAVVAAALTLSAAAPVLAGHAATSRPVDLDGNPVDAVLADGRRATVLIFVRSDCPISNRYAPEIAKLHDAFVDRGVRFWLVYPDPEEPADAIRRHIRRFSLPADAVRDPDHVLVALAGATMTPEAAIFDGKGRLIYRGRIDDRYIDFGRSRPAPTRRDVAEVLLDLVAGRHPAPRTTHAVGCYIADLQ